MHLFRQAGPDGRVVAVLQDMAFTDGSLRKREDDESNSAVPALPESLTSTPVEIAITETLEDQNASVVPTVALTSQGSGLLGLSLGLLPTTAAAAAAATSSTPASLLGLSLGVGLGGLLGDGSRSTTGPSTSLVQTPTSITSTSVAPVTNVLPTSSAISSASPPPVASDAPGVTTPTTTPKPALTSTSSSTVSAATQPAAGATSSTPPSQQTSATVKSVASEQSPSIASTSIVSSAASSFVSSAAAVSSAAGLKTSSATGQVALTTKDGVSQITSLSSTAPTAAAELNSPILASSMITSVTRTGSVPGVTTETTGSGIVVTETLAPSTGMSAGTKAGIIVGSAVGGLLLAALVLFLIRKFVRAQRFAKAESPPSSPLLNASNPPLSPMAPLRIEVGMHQRMRSNESGDFWISGKGSSIGKKDGEGYRYPMPISPLPRLPESLEEMSAERGVRSNAGFKFFPSVDRSGEGKEVMPTNF